MKKIRIAFLVLLVAIITTVSIYGASVEPLRYDGNDSNPKQYALTSDYTHYEIPNSNLPGTYTVRFNRSGQVDENGSLILTIVIGYKEGCRYTQVLSWTSNFPVYGIIVKGGSCFNLYNYSTSARSDSDLTAPVNASGKPADISHVSVRLYLPSLSPIIW